MSVRDTDKIVPFPNWCHTIPYLTIPRCKLGLWTSLGIQSWLWGSLCTSRGRAQVMMDPPQLWNPWVESTKVQNREYQWLHNMVTCHCKKSKETNFLSVKPAHTTFCYGCDQQIWALHKYATYDQPGGHKS